MIEMSAAPLASTGAASIACCDLSERATLCPGRVWSTSCRLKDAVPASESAWVLRKRLRVKILFGAPKPARKLRISLRRSRRLVRAVDACGCKLSKEGSV